MPDSKISFSLGSLSFAGEGEAKWLAEQLEIVIAAAPSLSKVSPPPPTSSGSGGKSAAAEDAGEFTVSLAAHLKAKGAESNQNKKFLVTADWLRRRGSSNLTTGVVTKALSENSQKRLGNASQCLNSNVSTGNCEKKGSGFFITTEGLTYLGYSQ